MYETDTQVEVYTYPVWTDSAREVAAEVLAQHDRKVRLARSIIRNAAILERKVAELNELNSRR
jgi:hypothetical protein